MIRFELYKTNVEKEIETRAELMLLRNDIEQLQYILSSFCLGKKAGFKTNQPRVPAGNPNGGQWTDGGSGSGRVKPPRSSNLTGVRVEGGKIASVPESWASKDIKIFVDHYNKHKNDFKAKSPSDYAKKAEKFRQRAIKLKLPAIEYNTGEIGIYEPKTNKFGLYTKEGKTITFYKPTSKNYFERQIQRVSSNGGRIINPISRGGGGRVGIGFINPKKPDDEFPDDDILKNYELYVERKCFPYFMNHDR